MRKVGVGLLTVTTGLWVLVTAILVFTVPFSISGPAKVPISLGLIAAPLWAIAVSIGLVSSCVALQQHRAHAGPMALVPLVALVVAGAASVWRGNSGPARALLLGLAASALICLAKASIDDGAWRQVPGRFWGWLVLAIGVSAFIGVIL